MNKNKDESINFESYSQDDLFIRDIIIKEESIVKNILFTTAPIIPKILVTT